MFCFLLTITGYRIYNRKRRYRKCTVTSRTYRKENMKMKRNKLKNLAVVLACTMMLGTMPSSIDAGSLPAITQTVEAAAKKVTLKASNKKVCAGKTVKINAKAMKGAKLSYKSGAGDRRACSNAGCRGRTRSRRNCAGRGRKASAAGFSGR